MSELKIPNKRIERKSSMKFLRVIFDEQISRRIYIRMIHNKILKNIGLLYRTKQLLDETSLKTT